MKLFVLTGICLLFACAQAQPASCLNATTVSATGFGISGQSPDEQFEQALASALASAITQVLGVYINSESQVTEVLKEKLNNEAVSTTAQTEFTESTTERFSGFITRYRLLDRRADENGLITTAIEAEVCTDARIALDFGDSPAAPVFAGELANNLETLGWQILAISGNEASNGPLEVGLQSGASYVAQGQLQTTLLSSSDSTRTHVATLTLSLVDVRTLEVVDTLTLSENGIGYSDAEAIQDAVGKLAVTVARDWSQQFLAPEQRRPSTVIINGISRSGSRFTLEEMVSGLPGVLAVTDTTYDEAAQAVTLAIEVSSSLCEAVEALTLERRIMMQLETCDDALAQLTATRE